MNATTKSVIDVSMRGVPKQMPAILTEITIECKFHRCMKQVFNKKTKTKKTKPPKKTKQSLLLNKTIRAAM